MEYSKTLTCLSKRGAPDPPNAAPVAACGGTPRSMIYKDL
jgi:hypothetical protein